MMIVYIILACLMVFLIHLFIIPFLKYFLVWYKLMNRIDKSYNNIDSEEKLKKSRKLAREIYKNALKAQKINYKNQENE